MAIQAPMRLILATRATVKISVLFWLGEGVANKKVPRELKKNVVISSAVPYRSTILEGLISIHCPRLIITRSKWVIIRPATQVSGRK